MQKQWVKQLQAGEKVDSIFALGDLSPSRTKNDALYMRLKIYDRSGSMEARIWDEEMAYLFKEQYTDGTIAAVAGTVETYNGQLQLIIKEARPYEEEYDLSLFLPSSRFSTEQLRQALQSAIESVDNEELRSFLLQLFAGDFLEKFCLSPAAQQVHHAYIGGLLEHSLEVGRFCWVFAREYPELDLDLLTTGALIHDIGKVDEYILKPGFPVDDRTRLTGGHIVLGRDLLRATLDDMAGFPPKLALALEHMIVSHHGIREWGALEEPSTVEAITLSQADLASARINQAVTLARETEKDQWSEYNNLLRRRLWVPDLSVPDLNF